MRLSRRERKLCNQSKQTGYNKGYTDGYEKGLHDGNPFNAIVDAINAVCNNLNSLMNDPEFVEQLKAQADNDDKLVIEGLEEGDSEE